MVMTVLHWAEWIDRWSNGQMVKSLEEHRTMQLNFLVPIYPEYEVERFNGTTTHSSKSCSMQEISKAYSVIEGLHTSVDARF